MLIQMKIVILERIFSSQKTLLIIFDSEKVKSVMNVIVVLNVLIFGMAFLHIIAPLVFTYIRVWDVKIVLGV